jgi:hypothetical protein
MPAKSPDEESVEEKEARIMEMEKSFSNLEGVHQKIPTLQRYLEGDEVSDDVVLEALLSLVRDLLPIHEQIEKSELKKFESHDLGGIIREVVTNADFAQQLIPENADQQLVHSIITTIVTAWPRYAIAVGDILLRGIDSKEVPKKYAKRVDLDVVFGALSYLVGPEKEKLEKRRDGTYENLKNISIVCDPNNFEDVQKKLNGREVHANTSVIGNFVLNAMRNAFSDRIEATEITLDMDVDEDEFVVRIMDNGKGMQPEHLEEDNPTNVKIREQKNKEHTYYIFEEGASGDNGSAKEKKSSGLGLANFPQRNASMGGKTYVYSKRKETGIVTTFPKNEDGTIQLLEKTFADRSYAHGTMFEIRLPLVTT